MPQDFMYVYIILTSMNAWFAVPRFISKPLAYWYQRNQSYKQHYNTHNRLQDRKQVRACVELLQFFMLPLYSCFSGWLSVYMCIYVFLNSVSIAEAEEFNSRLQATKQRVSELERTLSSVSSQQKQFEKVCSHSFLHTDVPVIWSLDAVYDDIRQLSWIAISLVCGKQMLSFLNFLLLHCSTIKSLKRKETICDSRCLDWSKYSILAFDWSGFWFLNYFS